MILLDKTFFGLLWTIITWSPLTVIFFILLTLYLAAMCYVIFGPGKKKVRGWGYNPALGIYPPKIFVVEVDAGEDKKVDDAHNSALDTPATEKESSTDGEAHTYVYVDPSHPDKEC